MRIGRALLIGALVLVVAASVRPPVRAGEPNRAGLVAQLSSGEVVTRCIPFEEDEISGAELLTRSGLDVVVDPASFMGVTVCRIEGVGCDHPAEPCFCQCMGGGTCTYWNYYFREPGAAEWTYSAMGAALRKVRPGSVEAWVWGQGDQPPAGNLTFATICAPASAEATPSPMAAPTAAPTAVAAAVSAVAPTAPDLPVGTPTAPPSPTLPAPAPTAPAAGDTGADLGQYWPFGLMVAGLAAVGFVLWRRRG